MPYFKSITSFFMSFLALAASANAQLKYSTPDYLSMPDSIIKNQSWQLPPYRKALNVKSYLAPGLMIAYGFAAIENDGLKRLNAELKDESYAEHPHNKRVIDNYLQFAPAVMVYGLDAAGIKARHSLKDRSMLFLMSGMITTGSVFTIKKLSHQLRPDGSDYFSFPSGHTAEAFANAEFLRQEYKDVSPWYGVAGYAVAATTGYLRMYNNKHWLSDVVAGAGVGIASAKLAYWLYPKFQRLIGMDKKPKIILLPKYQDKSIGFGLVHQF